MSSSLDTVSPNITTMIRMDHSHVLAAFRRFKPHASLGKKRALVANVCLALEIHAQLEEEIFYPALREAIGADEMLDKSVPEHDEMRDLIGQLRALEPDDPLFDSTFRALIRTVLHHVADEETMLLPKAEEVLQGELGLLGWQMTKRRMELLGPHAAEVAATTARTFPVGSAAVMAGIATIGWLLLRDHRPRSSLASRLSR